MWPKAMGKVTKIKPGPVPGAKLLANTMGKMARPASNAIPVSAAMMMMAERVIEIFLGRYAPYIIMEPDAKLKVKKAWPKATKADDGSNLAKLGWNKNVKACIKNPVLMAYPKIISSKISMAGSTSMTAF